MSHIKPFRGLFPKPSLAEKVASPPYDTLNDEEAREIIVENSLSYLRVVKSRSDMPMETDVDADTVRKKGRENLEQFISNGTLQQSHSPSFYLYQQKDGDHVQIGIVAGASVEEYRAGKIRKHEFTLQAKEDMITNHIGALNADAGPVILIYPDTVEIDATVEYLKDSPPLMDFKDSTGVQNTIWEVNDPIEVNNLIRLFEKIPVLYIADGHHRAAAASRIEERHPGDPNYSHFLTMIFPAGQKRILDYNRCVKDLKDQSSEDLVKAIEEKFEVEPLEISDAEEARPKTRNEFAMLLEDKWYTLKAKPEIIPTDPVGSLDVAILQENILSPLLGIENPRKEPRIDFVGGSRGLGELERRCSADCKIAFALYPTSVKDLMAIADADEVMPPKSTWFDPKPLSGVVVRRYSE